MMLPANIRRLIHINRVLSKNGLDEIIFALHLFRPLRYLYYVLPWNWMRRKSTRSRGERIRMSLEQLGPIFVKFGQILSTRRDLLPHDIADELAKLQDQVPPFATDTAVEIIEKAYGKTLNEVFASFDRQPLAAASVAQVYAAKLLNGHDVIVKVIRPGIEKTIHQDLKLLKTIASMAERYSPEARRLRPIEVVEDYEQTILNELDLKREGSNASLIKRQFEGSQIFYVPEVYWRYSKTNVLVMERISGVTISDVEQLQARKVNMKVLAERGVEIFFTQVFKHNFFHADMHPGNIFVNADEPENPKYIGVDFGIVGTLSQSDRRYLAENFLAFFDRDYRRVVDLHIHSGWAPQDVDPLEFEAAIRTVCEPIFERPLKEISFGHFLLNLFQTARRFNLHIQPQLVLLQKTLLNVEGLGRQLYPDLDLWQTAKPFLQKAMRKDAAYHSLLKKLPIEVPDWLHDLPEAPANVLNLIQKISEGRLEVKLSNTELSAIQEQIKKNARSQFYTGAGGALIVSAVIYGLYSYHFSPLIAGVPLQAASVIVIGLAFLFKGWVGKD